MTLITYTLTDAAMALPELPPLAISELAVGLVNLLQEAADLPAPVYITVSGTQSIGVQFADHRSSLRAVTRWALRFGGVLISGPADDGQDPQTFCQAQFTYYGVTVQVYAFITAGTATT